MNYNKRKPSGSEFKKQAREKLEKNYEELKSNAKIVSLILQ